MMVIKQIIDMSKRIIRIVSLYILFFSLYSCESNLGNHLEFWGDNNKYLQIVFCDGKNIFGDSRKCTYIIPSSTNSKDNFTEFVDSYAKNSKWVLVKTEYTKYGKQDYNINLPIDTIYNRYWAIDKSFKVKDIDPQTIINSYLTGPMNSEEFNLFLKKEDIVYLWGNKKLIKQE